MFFKYLTPILATDTMTIVSISSSENRWIFRAQGQRSGWYAEPTRDGNKSAPCENRSAVFMIHQSRTSFLSNTLQHEGSTLQRLGGEACSLPCVSISSHYRISTFEAEDLTKRRIPFCPGVLWKCWAHFHLWKTLTLCLKIGSPFKGAALIFCSYL